MAKCASYTTMLVALILEISPRSVFNNGVADKLLGFLLASSAYLTGVFNLTENQYGNYGAKFVLSNTVLVVVFFIVSFALVIFTAKKTPRLPLSSDQRRTMYNRLCVCIAAFVLLLAIQIIWPGFYLVGGRVNATPILWKGFIWSLLEWVIVMATVILRRGAWDKAA